MNLLLDTHVFLWWCDQNPQLSTEATQAIADPDNTIFFSLASAWEIAIKQALGRVKTPEPLENAVQKNRFSPLGISFEHARVAGSLPRHHRDPFDRMLIAQAKVDRLTFVTHDSSMQPYEIDLLWT
jgi:PIN domain nuclease of toxin-antitoxin system